MTDTFPQGRAVPSKSLKILLLSPESKLLYRIKNIFSGEDPQVDWITEMSQVLVRFSSRDIDIFIIDSLNKLDEKALFPTLNEISKKSPTTRILLLIEPDDIGMAMLALKAGLYHYAKHPVSNEEIGLLIRTALEDRPEYGVSVLLDDPKDEARIGQLAGKSVHMQILYKQIRRAASTDIPILLLGETGTGKDLVAHTIHRLSRRRKQPFVAVNLGSLPSELVASELFGHEKGAFTGASEQHRGVFERGEKGTVYLDEIDCVNERVKVSLLRLLEQQQFHRLGGRQALSSHARIIAASNANIEKLVENGDFRKDLFYRLDVFRIELPALRQRKSDIRPLAEEFLLSYNEILNKNIMHIDPESIAYLENFDWPGNIRELKNVIQRAALVCDTNVILPEHLPTRLVKDAPQVHTITFEVGTPLHVVEREMVLRALEIARDNRQKAAKLLGISRRAIYNKLKKHQIGESK